MKSRLLSYNRRIAGKCNSLFNTARHAVLQERFPMLSPMARLIDGNGKGVVLMLHRVAERVPGGIPNNEDLKVSPVFLQQTIDRYRKAGFVFVSMDDVARMVSTGLFPTQPFVAFTLDDGYLDNYTEALPVFRRNNVPFAIYLASDFLDKKAILWWYSLEKLVTHNSEIVVCDEKLPCRTFQEKWDAFRILREKVLRLNQANLLEELQKLFCRYEIDWMEPVKQLAMDWRHVECLANEPLCTIGGHTVSHCSLKMLAAEEDMKNEILSGNRAIAQHTGKLVLHFSYPYGEAGEREYAFVESQNLVSACLACGGVVKGGISRAACIPRVMLK